MRELRYENKGTSAYLVYEIREDDVIDSMSLGMLTNNKIDGIVPTVFSQLDDKKYVKFNISGKISAAQLFEGPVNKKRLIGLLTGVITAMTSAEDYMLDPQTMPLGMDYIFVDPKTSETVMICLPLENLMNNGADLGTFFKNIIFHTQFDQTENCDHVAQILNFLNSSPALSLPAFKELLDKISGAKQKTVSYEVNHQKQEVQTNNHSTGAVQDSTIQEDVSLKNTGISNMTELVSEVFDDDIGAGEKQDDEPGMSWWYLMQHYNKDNAAAYKAQKAKKKAQKADQPNKDEKPKKDSKKSAKTNISADMGMDFAIPGQKAELPKECDNLSERNSCKVSTPVVESDHLDYGHTELVVDRSHSNDNLTEVVRPYLLRVKGGNRVDITSEEFRIGRTQRSVDYRIDNNTVSGLHAKIVHRNGEYFVVDLHSTNSTYVNGSKIRSDEEVILTDGTKLAFSDEEFEFHLR